jgi:hypothetical protein
VHSTSLGENGMREIRFGFHERGDTELLRHPAEAYTGSCTSTNRRRSNESPYPLQ